MPSASNKSASGRTASPFERMAATCAALVVIALVAFLLIRNQPIADPRLFLALRIILSLGVAVFGATVLGFLEVGWSGSGLAVRAGGALALFVPTFLYTPDLVLTHDQGGQTTISAPGGVAAGKLTIARSLSIRLSRQSQRQRNERQSFAWPISPHGASASAWSGVGTIQN